MHMMGFTSWFKGDAVADDMRVWKFSGSRIFVCFPADADREAILSHIASALEEIDLVECGASDNDNATLVEH